MKKTNFLFYFLITFSIIILTFIFYKSEIVYNSAIREYYKYYIIFTIFIIILNICFIYLNNYAKIYLNIIIISTFFSIYSFEFYAVFIKKTDKEVYYKKKKRHNILYQIHNSIL